MSADRWTPRSWRGKPIQQAPDYTDPAALAAVERQLASFPPLVFAGEARKLKKHLAQVCAGEAFLLQGGDCAESFAEHGADNIRDFFRVFLQMAVVTTFAAAMPVVKVGRVAGQFAKPRSAANRATIGGVGTARPTGATSSTASSSTRPWPASPSRSARLDAYRQSAATLNLLRAFANGRLRQSRERASLDARLHQDSPQAHRYGELADRISQTIGFMRAIGLDPESHPELRSTEFYTSHEALLLGFEEALTRIDSTTGDPYATSGHMIWVGDRTRQLDHAHVEYARGVKNPLGLKCGPSLKPDELIRLIDVLNPGNEPGRLTLICRFGADKVGESLPPLLRAVTREGTPRGVVVRPDARQHDQGLLRLQDPAVRAIMGEIQTFFAVNRAEGTYARRHPPRDDRAATSPNAPAARVPSRRSTSATATTPIAIPASTPSRRSKSPSWWRSFSRRSASPEACPCRMRRSDEQWSVNGFERYRRGAGFAVGSPRSPKANA